MKLLRADGYIVESENEDVIKSLIKRGATPVNEDKPVKAAAKVKSKELIPEVVNEPVEAVNTVAKDYSKMTVAELRSYAESLGIVGSKNMSKATLIAIIEEHKG